MTKKQWETPTLTIMTEEEYLLQKQVNELCNHAVLMSELADECKDYDVAPKGTFIWDKKSIKNISAFGRSTEKLAQGLTRVATVAKVFGESFTNDVNKAEVRKDYE